MARRASGPGGHPEWSRRWRRYAWLAVAGLGVFASACAHEPVIVRQAQKISALEGGGALPLKTDDVFGRGVTGVGDWNLDGVPDIAVGAFGDDEAGIEFGALWILFLARDGTVANARKITSGRGGFEDPLGAGYAFGSSVTTLGDLDGDGLPELAVGGFGALAGDTAVGAVWVLFFDREARVRAYRRIMGPGGGDGVGGTAPTETIWGISVAGLGDVDGDGVGDLAVGARHGNDGGPWRGAVWILFLQPDGSLKRAQAISSTDGGFTGVLDDGDELGQSVAGIGDLDQDGVPDVAAGAFRDDDGGENRGAVWIFFLRRDGSVKAHAKVSSTAGAFTGRLNDVDLFGSGLAAPGDLDGDGIQDLTVGARRTDDGGTDRGALWLLFLNRDGSVRGFRKISQTAGGFAHPLDNDDQFGYQVGEAGDIDGDGMPDLLASAIFDDDGENNAGAVYVLFLDRAGLR